jgi:type IV secretion system protein VirD4
MQLPADEELVLVAGTPPIRARKLRYFSDRNFVERRLAPPVLGDGPYRDRPMTRAHDWPQEARSTDARLSTSSEGEAAADDGGLQQQRHPGIPEHKSTAPDREAADMEVDVADDGDSSADQRTMDQARGLTPAVRAHALNESSGHDLVPGL